MSMLWLVWWFEEGICFGFCIFRCEEALPKDGLPDIGCQRNLEGEWLHRKDWPDFLRDYVAEERVRDGFVFLISITRWNHMHIGIALWNNELVTDHWEEKWHRIVALDIGCKFYFAMDYGILGKEVNHGITLRVEMWAFGFPFCGCRHHILLFVGWVDAYICVCVYIIVNTISRWIYKAP